MARSGFGRHLSTLTTQEKIDARFYYVISTWPALLAIGMPKLAVAGLLCRVFSPGLRTRYFLWGIAAWGVLNFLVEAAFSTFQCIPVQALWDVRIEGAKCVHLPTYNNFSWYIGGMNRVSMCSWRGGREKLLCFANIKVSTPSIFGDSGLHTSVLSSSSVQENALQRLEEDRLELHYGTWNLVRELALSRPYPRNSRLIHHHLVPRGLRY